MVTNSTNRINKERYVSAVERRAVSVLLLVKTLIEKAELLKDDLNMKEMHEIIVDNLQQKKFDLLLEKIVSIVSEYDLKTLKRAKTTFATMLMKLSRHKHLSDPISLEMISYVVLYAFFVEGEGAKIRNQIYKEFQVCSYYDDIFEIYDESDTLDFLKDYSMCMTILNL